MAENPTSSVSGGAKTFDFFGVQRRSLYLFLIIDCSNSMQGEKIKSLNYAVRGALPAMKKAADDNPEADVYIRVLTFSDGASWRGPATPLHDVVWEDISAAGLTDLGAALSLLAEELDPARLTGRILPPVLILVSDGQPTDDFREGFAKLESAPLCVAGAVRIAIAIGPDADLQILQAFIGPDGGAPLDARDAGELANRMRWASTVTIQAAGRGSLRDVLQTGVAANPPDPFIWDS